MLHPQRAATMPVFLVCIIFLQLFFSSCADKIKTSLIVYKALDEGLVNSNNSIDQQSQVQLSSLEDRLSQPGTAEKAKVWYPKAMEIQKLSDDVYTYIEGLKAELKKEAGLKTHNGVESFKEGDKMAVMRLFEKKHKAQELYERLKDYKLKVLAVDPDLNKEFSRTLVLTTRDFDSAKDEDFWRTFFDDIPTMAALGVLSKFQNNVRLIENRTISFCDSHISSYTLQHSWPAAIVSQNISQPRPGESVEVMAGIGSFSSIDPIISIQGKKIPVTHYGYVVYKYQVSEKEGKYTLPIDISYMNADGNKISITKIIEYTVAKK